MEISSKLAASRAAAAIAEEAIDEARARTNRVQDQIQAERAMNERELTRTKQEGNDSLEMERIRQANAMEQTKVKGYEGVREIQKRQEEELQRLKAQSEKEYADLDHHYQMEKTRKMSKGEQDLRALDSEYQLKKELLTRESQANEQMLKSQQEQSLNQAREEGERRFQAVQKTSASETEKLRERSVTGRMEAEKRFNHQYEHNLNTYSEAIQNLEKANATQLQQIQMDHAQRLSEYTKKSKDPFYQIVKFESKFEDHPGAYVLKLKIPQHEQKNVAVSVNQGRILVSGTRTNTVKQEVEPGRVVQSSNHQNYHESFPIQDSVDAKQLRRESRGDELIVTLPKRGEIPLSPYRTPASKKS